MAPPRIRRIKNVRETFDLSAALGSIMDDALEALVKKAMFEKNCVIKQYRPSAIKTFVGGVEGRAEQSVQIGETIRYEFSYLKSIAIDAWETLRRNSPVHVSPTKGWGTTPNAMQYRDNHIVLADGIAYDTPYEMPDDVTEVIISNPSPYARKVEMRGWHKPSSVNFHVPYHTYEMSAAQLRKYANVVMIKFTFINLPGFAEGKGSKPGATKSDQARAIRYPALMISLR